MDGLYENGKLSTQDSHDLEELSSVCLNQVFEVGMERTMGATPEHALNVLGRLEMEDMNN